MANAVVPIVHKTGSHTGVYNIGVSGSGGDTGYDYQANAIAYVSAHALAGQPLAWFENPHDVPASWLVETGGPGDDLRIICLYGLPIEVQAKHGLQRGEEYDRTLQKLINGLQNAHDLRAVLLVDRHASQIIRSDLKDDLVRLGQGRTDGMKPITQALLCELNAGDQPDPEVFDRLRIVVVDLDTGADGVAAAQALLSGVVEPNNCQTAYDLLGKRGHTLIKARGRDDVHKCAEFLNQRVGLVRTGHSPAISTNRFAEWVRSSNKTFYSPALKRHFSVQHAWAQMAPMGRLVDTQLTAPATDRLQEQIERHQDWAHRVRGRWGLDAVTADAFVGSYRLSAIVGGPGAGKTTLCKRLAFFASADRLVVYVPLRTVAALLGHGSTFESAMIEAGTESSGQSFTNGRHILELADLLVADGLDECDPRRADVASGLSRWAQSHPHSSICVLTRPVGHDPGLLPGFSHAELLPLDDDTIRDVAKWMIESQCGAGHAPPVLQRFLDAIREGHQTSVASIAARSPLFLSFLVRLFVDGQEINGKRSVLFSRIVELVRMSPPLNRGSLEGEVDGATAWTAAEITGWSCITQPDRPASEICSSIARELGGGIDAARRAESAIHRWEEHGLIEPVTAGSLDALVFVHPALGEYLAGRRLAQFSAAEFARAITDYRRRARWREPIVLAAGSGAAQRVVDTLLALDSPDDPESPEALIAASALAESELGAVAQDTIEKVAAQLKLRLCLPIPLIAIDAGVAIAEIAPTIPDLAAGIALELWDHPQRWTRLAAICSGISGGSRLIPVEKIVHWIEGLTPLKFFSWGPDYPEWPSETYRLQASALPGALRRIATELPASAAEKIVTAFLSRGDLPSGLIDAAASKLNEKPYSD